MSLSQDIDNLVSMYGPNFLPGSTFFTYIPRLSALAADLEEEINAYRRAYELMEQYSYKFRKQRTEPEQEVQTMVKVNGKRWHCPDCGSNVQTKIGENSYTCNGCQSRWIGE